MNIQIVQCSNLVRAWAPEHSEEVPSGHSNPVGVIKKQALSRGLVFLCPAGMRSHGASQTWLKLL
ncbi:MAG: hypothetical protein IKA95_00125 [Clostridia bacterium]|nr:hypothetical protein [Clostridia bacterium]